MIEEIPSALDNERADRVVALLADVSRSVASDLIESGAVLIDNAAIAKPSVKVSVGQVISIEVADLEPGEIEADPSIEFEVVYMDDDVIVVNKPAGLIVHPGSGVRDGTLVNGLLSAFPEIREVGERTRPGIVHRLDSGTTGLLVVARNNESYLSLVEQLSTHKAQRQYVALTHGIVSSDAGTIDAPIGRSLGDRTRMGIVAEGRESRTHYVVQKRYESPAQYTLLNCQLETGRTHQIRVHLAAIYHPVVGDETYGGARGPIQSSRPLLHAEKLSFAHPSTGETGEFSAPLPQDFAAVLSELDVVNSDIDQNSTTL
jgi:23S rRNA pseudouridine1911/1915/1917 synthase